MRSEGEREIIGIVGRCCRAGIAISVERDGVVNGSILADVHDLVEFVRVVRVLRFEGHAFTV
jgi:hypothetical protein